MEEENVRIIEINGVKLEVDLRQCKVIENYKVGDQIKVLVKEYSDYKAYAGVIIGFDDFEKLPTISIAYLKEDYNGSSIEFVVFNEATKDKVNICPLTTLDRFFSQAQAEEKLDREIDKKKKEVAELEQKKQFFKQAFAKYFQEIKA